MRLVGIISLLGTLTLGRGVPVEKAKRAPKIMIVSTFDAEAAVWPSKIEEAGFGNLSEISARIPGLFPVYPEVRCTGTFDICQVTVGMGEINAAASTTALVLAPQFDLTRTYFLLAGVAGVSPQEGTLGSVALARFAVQVALQYEIDGREIPDGFATGYIPFGAQRPGQYPTVTYGTEIAEVSEGLRDRAYALARNAELQDSRAAAEHRTRYESAAARRPPSVVRCDVATSDVYYSGRLLSEALENTARAWTNGTSRYCMTASEDGAVLAPLVRAGVQGLVDVARVMIMRAGANFDRPPPNMTAYEHLIIQGQNGFDIAVENLGRAGIEIAKGILEGWDCLYAAGVPTTNYVGDIIGSLGGRPDFGRGSVTGNLGFAAVWGVRRR